MENVSVVQGLLKEAERKARIFAGSRIRQSNHSNQNLFFCFAKKRSRFLDDGDVSSKNLSGHFFSKVNNKMTRTALLATTILKRYNQGLYHVYKATRQQMPAMRTLSSISKEQKSRREDGQSSYVGFAIAGSLLYSLANTKNNSFENTTRNEPRRFGRNEARNVGLARMRSTAGRNLTSKYKVDWKTVLGEGAYGSVHPARLANTGEKVALKKISKKFTNSSAFRNETEALLRIYDSGGHPNISGLRDMYEDFSHFYLIFDLVKGGEMFDHLTNEGAYSEADSARLIFEVASALAFLHGVGVVHNDLKPENLLLCSKNRRDGTIKIIDFGCARISQPEISIATGAAVEADSEQQENGTLGYWPPERFESLELTSAVDTWAVGVILYIMLTGAHPFDLNCDRSDAEIVQAIKDNPYPPLDDSYVGHLSASAIDVINKLMEPDPKRRMTAYELLKHPWVQGVTATKEKMKGSDKKLLQFQDLKHQLEASIFAVLVSKGHQDLTMSEAKKENPDSKRNAGASLVKLVFDAFDEDGKGYVTGADIGRLVTEHTGEVLNSKHTDEFLKTQSGESTSGSEASLSDFMKLFKGMKHKHFPRGHKIFEAGEEGSSMYFLTSGKVEMQTRKGQLVSILRRGDFFGEGSLLDKTDKRFTTAKCATPVDVIEIESEEFDRYTKISSETRNELKRKWRARHLVYAKNLIRLERNVKTRVLKKGDTIYREGETGTSMFQVDDSGDGNYELEVLHGNIPVHKYHSGDSFGESSLLFDKPRSSTVRCISSECRVHEMRRDDFLAVVNSSPGMAAALRNMCRKRLFKKAVKQFSLQKNRGLSDDDIVAAFHDADLDNSGSLDVEEVRRLMHRIEPDFPMSEIHQLMKFVDVDEDGQVSLDEFKRIFRQFEDEKT